MAGNKSIYAERIIARARELAASDAFAPARGSRQSGVAAEQAKEEIRRAGRSTRKLVAIFGAASAVVALFSLLLPYYGVDAMGVGGTICSPGEVWDCYVLWFQLNVAPPLSL